MHEGVNCFTPESMSAGFGILPCRVGQATPKPGEPHQNRCTVFDEGKNYEPISIYGEAQDPLPAYYSPRGGIRTRVLSVISRVLCH